MRNGMAPYSYFTLTDTPEGQLGTFSIPVDLDPALKRIVHAFIEHKGSFDRVAQDLGLAESELKRQCFRIPNDLFSSLVLYIMWSCMSELREAAYQTYMRALTHGHEPTYEERREMEVKEALRRMRRDELQVWPTRAEMDKVIKEKKRRQVKYGF